MLDFVWLVFFRENGVMSKNSNIFRGVPSIPNYLERFDGTHYPHNCIPNSPRLQIDTKICNIDVIEKKGKKWDRERCLTHKSSRIREFDNDTPLDNVPFLTSLSCGQGFTRDLILRR